MKNKKLAVWVAVVLCVSVLAGCSKGGTGDDAPDLQKVPITENADNSSHESNNGSIPKDLSEGNDADSLLANAVIEGDVVEFSDTGCVISPQKTEEVEGGMLGIGAEPGHEKEEDNVTIHYGDNCQFQTAKLSVATGKADVSDAAVSDIKKRTTLAIYGERTDERNIEATKVIITRYE